MPRGTTPESRRARNIKAEKWDKDNTRQVKFKFNLRTDADILSHLDAQPNIQGYVKRLIRADIANNRIKEATAMKFTFTTESAAPESVIYTLTINNEGFTVIETSGLPLVCDDGQTFLDDDLDRLDAEALTDADAFTAALADLRADGLTCNTITGDSAAELAAALDRVGSIGAKEYLIAFWRVSVPESERPAWDSFTF